jgi:hypothetical protein
MSGIGMTNWMRCENMWKKTRNNVFRSSMDEPLHITISW